MAFCLVTSIVTNFSTMCLIFLFICVYIYTPQVYMHYLATIIFVIKMNVVCMIQCCRLCTLAPFCYFCIRCCFCLVTVSLALSHHQFLDGVVGL